MAEAEIWLEDNPKQTTLIAIEEEMKKMAIQAERDQAAADLQVTSNQRENVNPERPALDR